MKNIKRRISYNVFLIIIITIFMTSLVLASDTLGTFRQNTCIDLKQVCSNCSYNNITSITYPNSTSAISSPITMTKNGVEYTTPWCNNSIIGRYVVCGEGDVGGIVTVWCYDYFINQTGIINNMTETLFFIFIGLVLFVLFILSIYQMTHTEDYGWAVGYLSFAYILLIIQFFILYQISTFYVTSITIITTFTYFLWWLSMILFLPYLIGVGLYLLGKAVEDRDVKKYTNMGYTREEAKEMTKRK